MFVFMDQLSYIVCKMKSVFGSQVNTAMKGTGSVAPLKDSVHFIRFIRPFSSTSICLAMKEKTTERLPMFDRDRNRRRSIAVARACNSQQAWRTPLGHVDPGNFVTTLCCAPSII